MLSGRATLDDALRKEQAKATDSIVMLVAVMYAKCRLSINFFMRMLSVSPAQGGCFVWGTNTNTQMAKGGDDSDNLQPKRIGRTARFRPELEVVQLAFGSQVR